MMFGGVVGRGLFLVCFRFACIFWSLGGSCFGVCSSGLFVLVVFVGFFSIGFWSFWLLLFFRLFFR